MTDIRIRRATTGDAATLARVYRSAYAENRRLGFPAKAESATGEAVASWIEECRVYVAESRDEVVGGVRLEETAPARVKLSRLGVREDRKGEGVGGRLVEHAAAAAREDGYDAVWLTTPGEHPFLPDFYRRRGYEETGPYPLEYRDYDEIVMEKRLR